jgi:hypothetical protein
MSDQERFQIELFYPKWRYVGPVGSDAKGLAEFPKLEKTPGFYRFRFECGNVYIGQSGNLRSRMALYRGWPEAKSHTHRELFSALRSGGGQVDVIDEVRLDGHALDLSRRAVREFIEGWLRFQEKPSWNRDRWDAVA